METIDGHESHNRDLAEAMGDIRRAEAEVKETQAELEHAEHNLERAETELEEVEAHRPREVEVIVDRQRKCVAAGIYIVAKFKELVGVAADRELDLLKDGTLHPLDDGAEIRVHECETFVSHARTGGSA